MPDSFIVIALHQTSHRGVSALSNDPAINLSAPVGKTDSAEMWRELTSDAAEEDIQSAKKKKYNLALSTLPIKRRSGRGNSVRKNTT